MQLVKMKLLNLSKRRYGASYCIKACEILIYSSHIIAENDNRGDRCGWEVANRNRVSVMSPWVRGETVPYGMVQPAGV